MPIILGGKNSPVSSVALLSGRGLIRLELHNISCRQNAISTTFIAWILLLSIIRFPLDAFECTFISSSHLAFYELHRADQDWCEQASAYVEVVCMEMMVSLI